MLWPMLGCPSRAMKKHHLLSTSCGMPSGNTVYIDTIINNTLIVVILQCSGKQLPNPINSVLGPRYRINLIIKESRKWFANRPVV